MAKAILEFDLNDPEDKQAHLRAIKALDMAGALWDITHNTKKNLEWDIEDKNLDKYEVVDLVFEKIFSILDEHDIDTDKLY